MSDKKVDITNIKTILETALLAAGRTLSVDELQKVFRWGERPDKKSIRAGLTALEEDYAERGIELKEVASGFRIQVRPEFGENLDALFEERSPRYSRALLETLALVAYRQPITRGEIEEVRGVAVSSNIVRTLLEREWIRGVGHRDVPGKPEMFGTTAQFLDYFNLKKLDDLPPLSELTDIEGLKIQLDLPEVEGQIISVAVGSSESDESVTEGIQIEVAGSEASTPSEDAGDALEDEPHEDDGTLENSEELNADSDGSEDIELDESEPEPRASAQS